MFVKFDIAVRRMGLERDDLAMVGAAEESAAVMEDDAIVNDSDVTGFGLFSGIIPAWSFENDVVGLPFAGTFAGVYEGRGLAVNGARLAIGIGLIIVRIENLDFVSTENIHTVVSAALAGALDFGRGGEFKVHLEIAEFILGADAPGFGGFHVIILEFPLYFLAAFTLPFGKVFSVKENDGVGRSVRLLVEVFPRLNDSRLGTAAIVNVPFGSGDEGSIIVTQALHFRGEY